MYRALMIIAAGEGIAFGLGNLLLTDVVLSVLGGQTEGLGRAAVQQLGGVIIGYGVVAWFVRDLAAGRLRRGVTFGIAISFTLSGLIATYVTVVGLLNAFGWALALAPFVVAVGLAWVLITPAHAEGVPEPIRN